MNYLTEQSLGDILVSIYGTSCVESQVKYNTRSRFDYVVTTLDNRKLAYEFDGHFHYTDPNRSLKELCNQWYKLDDYYVMRIPYWLQPDARMSEIWFSLRKDFSNGYPHGFIDKKAVLPMWFCTYGFRRFCEEMNNLPYDVRRQVVSSCSTRDSLVSENFM